MLARFPTGEDRDEFVLYHSGDEDDSEPEPMTPAEQAAAVAALGGGTL